MDNGGDGRDQDEKRLITKKQMSLAIRFCVALRFCVARLQIGDDELCNS
jgi:hypothetical protein